MYLKAHQAIHGYSEGHRQLACSANLSTKDARLLLVMSDVSGPGVAGTGTPYLTGYPLPDSGLYALSKTWPAPEMPRPGCVWTHTVFISFTDLAMLEMPSALAGLFERPSVESLSDFGKELRVEVSPEPREPMTPIGVHFLAVLATALYGHPVEQIWARRTSNVDVEEVVLRLWDQQWPRLRRSFKFCTLTTRDRSQDSISFDLQLAPSGGTTARLRFASTLEGIEAAEQSDDLWLANLVRDADLPFRSSLCQMLRQLGADVLGGREAMRPICSLHAALEAPSQFGVPVAVALVQELPPLSTSDIAKAMVVRTALENDLLEPVPEVLEFVVNHFDLLADSDALKHAAVLARLVWRADPRSFVVFSYGSREKIRAGLRAGIAGVDRGEILNALSKFADLAEPVLGMLPELAVDQRFWADTQLWPASIAVLGIDLSRSEVLQAMIEGLRDEGAINSALHVAGASTVLKCIEELIRAERKIPQLQRWIRQACVDMDGVAFFLSHSAQQSPELLLLIAEALPPDTVPNDYGEDPWCVALYSLRTSLGRLPVELSSYGFRRALSWRSRSAEPLLQLTFEPLYAAATEQSIPVDCWRLIEGALPWVPSSDAWDFALRLRRATAKKCIDLPVRSEGFAKLVASDLLFIELMDAVCFFWNGSRYLRGVKDALHNGTDAPLAHRRLLIKQFVKDRSKFW